MSSLVLQHARIDEALQMIRFRVEDLLERARRALGLALLLGPEARHAEQQADALGASAVVGVDLDYEVINNMLMVSASGTAVVLG